MAGIINVVTRQDRLLPRVTLQGPSDQNNLLGNWSLHALGTVHFPISCWPELQKPFDRGVALLHSFWYDEARKQFEWISQQEKHCDMAYWGIAMSYWAQLMDWPSEADVKAANVAISKTGFSASPRERDYIAAIAGFYNTSRPLDFFCQGNRIFGGDEPHLSKKS